MAGTADRPPQRRSAGQPHGHPRPGTEPLDCPPPAAPPTRPVALLVCGGLDGRTLARRLGPHFQITATTDLPTALAAIADTRLDVVLIDATLPDAEMIEVVAQIRVRQWRRDLAIICYGAVGSGAAVSALAGAAARELIIEPVDTAELVARITAALSRPR